MERASSAPRVIKCDDDLFSSVGNLVIAAVANCANEDLWISRVSVKIRDSVDLTPSLLSSERVVPNNNMQIYGSLSLCLSLYIYIYLSLCRSFWYVVSVSLVVASFERFGRSCSSRSSGLFRPSGARLGCSFCFASVSVVRSIYLLCCRAPPLLVLAAHVEAPLVRSSPL